MNNQEKNMINGDSNSNDISNGNANETMKNDTDSNSYIFEKKEENKMISNDEPNIENNKKNDTAKLLVYSFISLIISSGTMFLASFVNSIYVLLVMPIYFLIGTIITKNKDFTLSIMLGTMFGALLLFVMSIINTAHEDLFTYISIECVAIGIVSYVIFSLLYKIVHDKKNTKGIHVLEFIILICGISYGIYYVTAKYPNYISKYLYCDNEIIAQTEKEYVIETLKSRYGIKFYCDKDLPKVKNNVTPEQKKVTKLIDQNKRRIERRYCGDIQGNLFLTESIYYSTNKYVVFDEYANNIMLKSSKEDLVNEIINIEGVKDVTISLYIKDKCHFVGECADVEEYYENIENENNIEKQYKINNELDFKNYVDYNSKDFINELGFKYQVKVEGTYNLIDESFFDEYVERIINIFNEKNYRNKNGMEIIFYEISNSELKIKKAHYLIEKNNGGIFEKYKRK